MSLPVNASAQSSAVDAIKGAITQSQKPCIFVDALVHRFNATQATRQLVDQLGVPVFAAVMGKGLIDETHNNYVGIYNGQASAPGVADALEKSDLVIVLGSVPADTNTATFSRKIAEDKSIEINPTDVKVQDFCPFERDDKD